MEMYTTINKAVRLGSELLDATIQILTMRLARIEQVSFVGIIYLVDERHVLSPGEKWAGLALMKITLQFARIQARCVSYISAFYIFDGTWFFSGAWVSGNDFGASGVAFVSDLIRLLFSFPMFGFGGYNASGVGCKFHLVVTKKSRLPAYFLLPWARRCLVFEDYCWICDDRIYVCSLSEWQVLERRHWSITVEG
jgi:hypothetical protein